MHRLFSKFEKIFFDFYNPYKNVMLDYNFDKCENILHVKAIGEIDFPNYINGLKKLTTDSELPGKIKILEDMRELITNPDVKVIGYMSEGLNSVSSRFTRVRHALIIDNPAYTAFALILKARLNHESYTMNIFSTREAAYNWLKDDPGFDI